MQNQRSRTVVSGCCVSYRMRRLRIESFYAITEVLDVPTSGRVFQVRFASSPAGGRGWHEEAPGA
eukprot:6923128-Pyramimonas_sp.AAC.1